MTSGGPNDGLVLVTDATGKQGGAVARALLAAGTPVRAFVRNPDSAAAKAVEALGASLVTGDLLDKKSVLTAAAGARAVFSVQMPDMADLAGDSELVQGRNLVEAAHEAGVRQFVHTSVSGAGEHHRAAVARLGRGDTHYWRSKGAIEQYVREAGFTYWTVLRPAFFMENFFAPQYSLLNMVGDRIVTVMNPETVVPMVAVRDVGAAAIHDPAKFARVDLELAGDRPRLREIAEILSDVRGRNVELPSVSSAELLAQGVIPELVESQEWSNEVVSPAGPEHARAFGLNPGGFKAWAAENLRH